MTGQDREIRYIQKNSGYDPMTHGMFSGQPTVSLKLSSSDSNAMNIKSLEKLMISYKWKKKLDSGYARLRIFGHDPLSEEHAEALEFLFDVIDPRFVDFELEEEYITSVPSRAIQRKADTYTLFFDMTKDDEYDEEALEYLLENCTNHGSGQFMFKSDSSVHESEIREFAIEHRIHDSDIWVYPKGRKVSTVKKNLETVENYAKRNSWNVSPRTDVIHGFEEAE